MTAAPTDTATKEFRRGLRLLVQGRLLEGWALWQQRPPRLESPLHALPVPEWQGQDLRGRSILVVGEQGIGDEIMFGRFLPRLRDLGAARITLACRPENLRALEQLGADTTISRLHTRRSEVLDHDFWTQLGSLPHWLRIGLDDLSGAPYLTAPSRGPGSIGLVPRGNPHHEKDHHRSIDAGALSAMFPQGRVLEPSGDVLDSLVQVAGLDVLISVDTSWAHMAGAVGTPCFVLLSQQGLDWRWLQAGDRSPWYDSLRLFRQPAPDSWGPPLVEVLRAVAALPRT